MGLKESILKPFGKSNKNTSASSNNMPNNTNMPVNNNMNVNMVNNNMNTNMNVNPNMNMTGIINNNVNNSVSPNPNMNMVSSNMVTNNSANINAGMNSNTNINPAPTATVNNMSKTTNVNTSVAVPTVPDSNTNKQAPTDVYNKNKKLQEIKKDEKVNVINEVRSVYDENAKLPHDIDPVREQQKKQIETLKRQKDYEILLNKIRAEEKQKAAAQEQIRIEREKIAKARIEKEKLIEERDAKILKEIDEKQNAKEKEKKASKGYSSTIPGQFSLSLSNGFDPKKELELEAKKEVLAEQFTDASKEAARMATPILFDYLARNSEGVLEKGSLEALSRVDVYSFLIAEGYDVYEINAAKISKVSIGGFKFKKSRLIFYLSQLSAYLKSGIALADAIKILEQQANKLDEKKVWRAVYYDLSMGDVLSNALGKRGNIFPKLLVNMVKTAEMTGNLTETLDDMVEYYTETEATRKQMISAMTYPAAVTLFASAVVTFILMWVVPQFVAIYKDLGADLPIITQVVMKISDFLTGGFLFILIGIIIACIIFIYLYKNVIGFKRGVQILTMKLPVFGNIIIYNEVTVFTKTFSNLLNHNVFITDSMQILSKITNNEVYKKLIYDTNKNLVKGDPISKAFENQWAFPNIAYQMLLTGEKTGRLGPMMERVSNYYQEQHRNIINSMKSLIEPVLIISLALIVGGILIAVIIPMFGMYEAL